MLVTISIRATTGIPYHTCEDKNLPDSLRQKVTVYEYNACDLSSLLQKGKDSFKCEHEESVLDKTALRLGTLIVDLETDLNLHNMELSYVTLGLDLLFKLPSAAYTKFGKLTYCVALHFLHMNTDDICKSILKDIADAQNTDMRLFIMRYPERFPELITDIVNKTDFTEDMLLHVVQKDKISPAFIIQAVNPVLFVEHTKPFFSFMEYGKLDLITFISAPGNNFQTGMLPVCVFTGNQRLLLVVSYEKYTDDKMVTCDGAEIYTVAPLQFLVVLPRCSYDMLVCCFSYKAVLALMDANDIKPLYGNGENLSSISARVFLAHRKIIPDTQCDVIHTKFNVDALRKSGRGSKEIVLRKIDKETIKFDVGTVQAVSSISISFKSSVTGKTYSIDSNLQNIRVGVTGLLTLVEVAIETGESDAGKKINMHRFDEMDTKNIMPVNTNNVHTMCIRCNDDSSPHIYTRFACTTCPSCKSMLDVYGNELILPSPIKPMHLLYAFSDEFKIASTEAQSIENKSKTCRSRISLHTCLPNMFIEKDTIVYPEDVQLVFLTRYLLHIANRLPLITVDLPAHLKSILELNVHDNYLHSRVLCLEKQPTCTVSCLDKWTTITSEKSTHAALCAYWELPETTIFVGSKRMYAILNSSVGRDIKASKIKDVQTNGFSAFKFRSSNFITLYRLEEDVEKDGGNNNICMFARCQNGNDRIVTASTTRNYHASYNVYFRQEYDEPTAHLTKIRLFPCVHIPPLPTVTYVGQMFVSHAMIGEMFMKDNVICRFLLGT